MSGRDSSNEVPASWPILVLLCSLFFMSCGSSKRINTNADIDEGRPDGLIGRVEDKPSVAEAEESEFEYGLSPVFTDTVAVSQLLNFLASDELGGRDSGSTGIEEAAVYIESFFNKNGVSTYFASYRDTLTNYQKISYNLVGLVPGNDKELSKEYIIVGAHYDHIGTIGSSTNDSIANGANDNASGTVTVLELARYFGQRRTNKRSLLFVLFSAEEKGLLGSKHLANRLKEQDFELYAMLNFEMTGVPMPDKDYLLFLTGYNLSSLAEVSNKYAGENLIGYLPQAEQFQLFFRSDNYPFHQVFQVPSQTFCSFDFTNYDFYHKVGDEAWRLNYEHMTNVINKMIPVIQGIANNEENEIKYN